MTRTAGLKENFAPIKKISDNTYVVSCDYKEGKNGHATWMWHKFTEKPTIYQIQDTILEYYNSEVDKTILNGFTWNDMSVWLSSENQFNYKAAYDLAVQTQGASLPVTLKFGSTKDPIYYTFTNLEEFSQFYLAAMNFINDTLANGWVNKDSVDWSIYENIQELESVVYSNYCDTMANEVTNRTNSYLDKPDDSSRDMISNLVIYFFKMLKYKLNKFIK